MQRVHNDMLYINAFFSFLLQTLTKRYCSLSLSSSFLSSRQHWKVFYHSWIEVTFVCIGQINLNINLLWDCECDKLLWERIIGYQMFSLRQCYSKFPTHRLASILYDTEWNNVNNHFMIKHIRYIVGIC